MPATLESVKTIVRGSGPNESVLSLAINRQHHERLGRNLMAIASRKAAEPSDLARREPVVTPALAKPLFTVAAERRFCTFIAPLLTSGGKLEGDVRFVIGWPIKSSWLLIGHLTGQRSILKPQSSFGSLPFFR